MDEYNSQLFLDKNLGFQQNKDIISPLVIKMDSNHLEFGIYIDDNINPNHSSLFKVNLRENKQELRDFFKKLKHEYNFTCRSYSKNKEDDFTWTTFFNEVIHTDTYFVAIKLTKNEVLQYSFEKLCGYITQAFERLFPLVLLATSDNPMPAIRKYLNLPKPEYSLKDCVDKIGIEKAKLERWLRTVERKRQVIFFGSPGTGKTFIAEQIARFLTNDNNEQWELVQFHPAYSYTEFPIEKLIQELAALNRAIADKHYELGISFFLTENIDKHIADIWQMEIEPYLEEYFFDQPDKVEEFRWQRIESKIIG